MFVHTSALSNVDNIVFISEDNAPTATRSSPTTEIARDADGVRSHPGSSVVVPIDAAYMTSYYHPIAYNSTSTFNRS